ncbi:MmyB family transcriptional regulator [Streptomyces mayteni]
MLDSMTVPALVYNTRQDVIAANLLGRAMFAPLHDCEPPNLARFTWICQGSPGLQPWEELAHWSGAAQRRSALRYAWTAS